MLILLTARMLFIYIYPYIHFIVDYSAVAGYVGLCYQCIV